MSAPSASVTAFEPPAGWQRGDLWGNLVLETASQPLDVVLAALLLILLFIGRAALGAHERARLRMPLAMLTVYLVSLPIRAGLLSAGREAAYCAVRVGGTVALTWGLIGVGGLLVFDLVGHRLGIPRIIRDVTTTIACVISLVTILSRSGVNLLSLITTSAVLTAVIGLALQDTLGNLLSGIALQLESSVAIGDWIRVDERAIGQVMEIRWRSLVLQTKNGDTVIIPNGLFSKGVITNFNKDGLQNRRWVYFNVHLRHPPNQVQKVVLNALDGVPNVSAETPPDCIVWAFKESYLEYAIRYRLIDYRPDDPTDSEVRKRVWYALHRHNIEIPYPGHNVFVTELNAAREHDKADRERVRRLEALAKVTFLAPLDEADRADLAACMRHEVFGRGEVILRAGEPGDSLYLLSGGEVTIRIGASGLEEDLATLRAGDFFGEMSLMTGEPRHATVIAKDDSDCYVIDRALFQRVLARRRELAGEIGRLLAEREVALKHKQEGLSARVALHSEHQALIERIKVFFGLG
jgi:small-conductance mechanosensitive channel/CRP-like cAMP-binding protein